MQLHLLATVYVSYICQALLRIDCFYYFDVTRTKPKTCFFFYAFTLILTAISNIADRDLILEVSLSASCHLS